MSKSTVTDVDSVFWESIGVFPQALLEISSTFLLREQSISVLTKLGPGNLRLIGERIGHPLAPSSNRDLATEIIDHLPTLTISCLKEFLRNRIPEVEDVFLTMFRDEIDLINSDLANLCRRYESLKVFSKLILLFHRYRESLRQVFFLALWRSRPTVFDYGVQGRFPVNFESQLIPKLAELVKVVSSALSDRSVNLLGHYKLDEGTIVLALNREFSPAIKRDFIKKFTLHYLVGVVVIGVNVQKRRIDIRCANKRLGEAASGWFKRAFELNIHLLSNDVCADYEPSQSVKAFLGGYKTDSKIELTAIRFRRTNFPNQPTLTLAVKPYASSLRDDVLKLQEANLVHAESLTDIESVRVSYETKDTEIDFETDRGALCLRFNNAGWDEVLESNFKSEFHRTFGIPLNKRIDPTRMASGSVGVIQYLLGIQNESDILPFQAEIFEQLATRGLLGRSSENVRQCRNPACAKYEKKVVDVDRSECERCGRQLKDVSLTRVRINPKRVLEVVREIFGEAGWILGKEERQFEKASYYPLRSPADFTPRTEICLFVHDDLSSQVRKKFERSARPIILIKTKTDERHAHLDERRTGVYSLAYILASEADPKLAPSRVLSTKKLLDDLVRTTIGRMVAAAEQSYDVLRSLPPGRKGYEYETDIFNLLKSIFPETIMLGAEGAEEPDGYCSLPYYKNLDLGDGRAWSFTYDAKLSYAAKGYELDIDEKRKMVSYITKFRKSKLLRNINKRIMAHVIISNNMSNEAIRSSYEYLMSESGLKKNYRTVRLVYMTQAFLVTLYERRRMHEARFGRRETYLAERLIGRITSEQKNPDGYVILGEEDANELVNSVLEDEQQYPTVDADRLAEGKHD
jgi:hypothetical protein